MARLAVTTVLLTLLVVALCRVIDGEVTQTQAAAEPDDAAVLPDAYIAGTPVAVVPADLDAASGEEAAVLRSHVLPASSEKVSGASPADDDKDQGFLRVPCNLHCRYRYMRWARRHGRLHRQDVYGEGFQGQEEKQLVAHGEERREEEVVLPVAEPDPNSHQDAAAVDPEELVQKPTAIHGEEGDEHDEMARAWRRFHHHCHHHHQDIKHEEDDDHEQREENSPMRRFRSHRRRRHHHHQDENEEDDHKQDKEASPVERLRIHHDDEEDEKSEMGTKRFHHHDKDDDSDDEDELEEMARRWIRKALVKGRMPHHHGRRFHYHHHLRFRHRAEDAAGGEEEKSGVMRWIKDFVNRF